MTLLSMIKSNAKRALHGNWGKAIGTLAVWYSFVFILALIQQHALNMFSETPAMDYGSVSSLRELLMYRSSPSETVITSIFLLLTVLLGAPLQMGVLSWYYSLVQGKSLPVADIFRFFESFKAYRRTVWLFISLFMRAVLWGALYLLPPSAMCYFSINAMNSRYGLIADNSRITAAVGTVGLTVSILLMILAAILYAVFMNRYALAAYLFFDDPDLRITKSLRLSIAYTKGYRGKLFMCSLSFIGWFLLCALMIPILYVVPYYGTVITLYSRYIIEKNKLSAGDATQEFQVAQAANPEPDETAPTEPDAPSLQPAETLPYEDDLMLFPQNTSFIPPSEAVPEEESILRDTAPIPPVYPEEEPGDQSL